MSILSNNPFNLDNHFIDTQVQIVIEMLHSMMERDDIIEMLEESILEYIDDFAETEPSDEEMQEFANQVSPLIIDKAVEKCKEEEKSWPEETDCDRLTQAFEELSENGIVAKENFTCCGTCGHSEIYDHAQDGDYGYVFYHQQDTERAVEGSGLYLAFGHIGLAKKSMEEVTGQIIETLKSYGFNVDWNGSGNTRMFIQLDWKKRINFG